MLTEPIHPVKIRTLDRIAEIAWFDDICGGDTAFLGTVDPSRRSNYTHCNDIITTADSLGFKNIYATMQNMSERAEKHGRVIDFGLRIHVIVRETEVEAKAYTKHLMSKFDAEVAHKLKNRTQDSQSAGVLRQDELRKMPTPMILLNPCFGRAPGARGRVAQVQ